jgi:hypothetical protein
MSQIYVLLKVLLMAGGFTITVYVASGLGDCCSY